jgi:hypothetical protein
MSDRFNGGYFSFHIYCSNIFVGTDGKFGCKACAIDAYKLSKKKSKVRDIKFPSSIVFHLLMSC